MYSARRKNRLNIGKKKGQIYSLLIKVVIPLLIVLSVVLYLKLSTKYWNGVDKFAFVFQKASRDVDVTVLDPALGEETTLIIPGETEVDVARSYGSLRIKNVWQLGVNERLGGTLLAETVTRSFLFPTSLWSGQDLGDPWKFIFGNKNTNIPFGDRVGVVIFALRVKSIDKTEIDLGKNQFLRKQILTDGTPGYVASGPISGRLTVYFSDNNFGDKNLRFTMTDSTGTPGVADGVGQVLEVLGGKVVAVDRKPADSSLDCVVSGQNFDAVWKVAALFSCQRSSGKSDFDLEIKMGAKFAKRF
jgi:hypothetical protein